MNFKIRIINEYGIEIEKKIDSGLLGLVALRQKKFIEESIEDDKKVIIEIQKGK